MSANYPPGNGVVVARRLAMRLESEVAKQASVVPVPTNDLS